jgi:rhamnosyltransferase
MSRTAPSSQYAAAPHGAAAAVVLYRPEPAMLERLLELLQQDGRRFFVFVNGALDDECRKIIGTVAEAAITWSEHNRGLAVGLNALASTASAAGYSHLLLLDQDSEPEPGLIDALLAEPIPDCFGKVAIIAPRLVPPSGTRFLPIRYAWRKGAHDPFWPVEYAPTSGSLLSLAAFTTIGRFRDDFFVGGIDVEWGLRAWSRGYASLLRRDLCMPHRWGSNLTAGAKPVPQILRHSPLRNYFHIRNSVAMLKLGHVPWRWRASSAVHLIGQIALLAWRRRDGAVIMAAVRDGLAGNLGPAPERLSRHDR